MCENAVLLIANHVVYLLRHISFLSFSRVDAVIKLKWIVSAEEVKIVIIVLRTVLKNQFYIQG